MMLLGEGRQQGWLWAAVLPLPSFPFSFVGRHSLAIQHIPCWVFSCLVQDTGAKTWRLSFCNCIIVSHHSHATISHSAPSVWTWKVHVSKLHSWPFKRECRFNRGTVSWFRPVKDVMFQKQCSSHISPVQVSHVGSSSEGHDPKAEFVPLHHF